MAGTHTEIGPNDPCICGSEKKYKKCCGTPEAMAARQRQATMRTIRKWGLVAVGITAVIGAGVAVASLWEPESDPMPVIERPVNTARPAGSAQPPGQAPPGKVWSAEHGHWHDAAPQGATSRPMPTQNATPAQRPPGPAPEGKVWSEEHGHWHDAP